MVKIKKTISLMLLLLLCFGCTKEETKIFEVSCDVKDIYIEQTSEIYINSNMEITINNLNEDILEIKSEQSDKVEVIGIAEGNGQIEILGEEGYKEVVSINVKKYPIPTGLDFKIKEEGPYYIGETYHLEYNLTPVNALDNIYLNYNLNAMTINNETLEVVFNIAGEFNITCYSYDNMELENTIQVEVLYNPDIEMYRLLFVGNSLTQSTNNNYNIPYIVRDMIKADGIEVICDVNVTGGAWISDQKYSTEAFLRKNRYTHVILQEQSAGPITNYSKFETAVVEISEMVKDNKAKLILYQTWAYNIEKWNWMTKAEMQAKLIEAYDRVAERVGASVNRAGEAFVNYESREGRLPSLYIDLNHPSIYGAYLSACVHYASITGRKASDNAYVMVEIEYEIMKIIQEIADEVVFVK